MKSETNLKSLQCITVSLNKVWLHQLILSKQGTLIIIILSSPSLSLSHPPTHCPPAAVLVLLAPEIWLIFACTRASILGVKYKAETHLTMSFKCSFVNLDLILFYCCSLWRIHVPAHRDRLFQTGTKPLQPWLSIWDNLARDIYETCLSTDANISFITVSHCKSITSS